MKYIDGFRDPAAAAAIRRRIAGHGAALASRRVAIMEVCGSHTMAIARYGIRDALPANVDLISGPGCPVCVTETGYIDAAIALAERGVTLVTLGDLLPVPGSASSLAACRAAGGRIEVAYSPAAALALAAAQPRREVVFLAIGFETTIAPVVSLVDAALRRGLGNLALLTAFKLVPPALRALRADPDLRIDAFLCPAHVSAIIGPEAYEPFAGPDGVPCVIAGFEPLDILLGLEGILAQLAAGVARVENQYRRVVKPGGNPRAQALFARYLEPADVRWRGLGLLPGSGLRLRPEYAAFDAERRHGLAVGPGREAPGCLCGAVIKGQRRPADCPLFGRVCTPDRPVGPCMVSAEGSCAAQFKYGRTAAGV